MTLYGVTDNRKKVYHRVVTIKTSYRVEQLDLKKKNAHCQFLWRTEHCCIFTFFITPKQRDYSYLINFVHKIKIERLQLIQSRLSGLPVSISLIQDVQLGSSSFQELTGQGRYVCPVAFHTKVFLYGFNLRLLRLFFLVFLFFGSVFFRIFLLFIILFLVSSISFFAILWFFLKMH